MEKYGISEEKYDVFSASMTVDTETKTYLDGNLSICKSCQCNCRTCLGGKAPEGADIICEKDAENALEILLAA